ncbi:putative pectate lyase 4 [Vitis vinifera]|uniref:Pectate lyase n=1 Tax=Vitis vinifera TaxID=29760 RepID=A0A438CRT5_VITVI|nr:putative pectate lyase 4 [Vitis vinifera]
MAFHGCCFTLALALLLHILVILFTPNTILPANAHRSSNSPPAMKLNVIDRCWRRSRNWQRHRQLLATCSVGFSGKMTNNIGTDLIRYEVTDPSDHPLNPKPGTLRFGATNIKGKVWITFKQSMRIKLEKPLLISSFTTIDGRGASIHIAGGACLLLHEVTNVIIHGIRIHHCRAQMPGQVLGPDSKMMELGHVDGDAIRLVASSQIWIDHNTLYECQDGLLDVTRGSTDITISNNWFRNHDKVMLLGHDDEHLQDKNMKVTVAFNHFGPNCYQRMPRVRHGYTHVVNNLYLGWEQYAIGGSMNPSVLSEANLFIAPESGTKEVTWRQDNNENGRSWNFQSVRDVFENGAHFSQTGDSAKRPHYNHLQTFRVADAKAVRPITRSSGALRCRKRSRC